MLSFLYKSNPLGHIDGRSGRGLYTLYLRKSFKTVGAEAGITMAFKAECFDAAHSYLRVLQDYRTLNGSHFCLGSLLIAAQLLRKEDQIHFVNLHTQVHTSLYDNLTKYKAKL